MRVAENNGTGGAMMRMSRPQPVSLDKGLCRMGIRSHTAENDTLPYPCDAEIRHRMSENLERSGYISHMLGKEISSRVRIWKCASIISCIWYRSGFQMMKRMLRFWNRSTDSTRARNIGLLFSDPEERIC